VSLLAHGLAFSAQSVSPHDAIAEYFAASGHVPQLTLRNGVRSVEVCFDTCDFYRFFGSVTESAIWDLVFLHQYFINAAYHIDNFKLKYESVAKEVLVKHRSRCPGVPEDQLPACLLTNIGKQHRVSYAFVRYDEGYRCQVAGRLVDPSFEGRSSCKRYGHAP